VIWLAIGLAITAWFIGLLLEIGPVVHMLLILAAGLTVFAARRSPGPTGS
jgi:hypothetical protein